MATVVRIKRRSEDEPLEALILNCKRQKLSDSSNDVVLQNPELSSTVLTLAGTIEENENVLTHLRKQNLDEIKEGFKKHGVDLTKKLRAEHQTHSKNNRYKVVNFLRSQNTQTRDENDTDINSAITIVEVISNSSGNKNNIDLHLEEAKYVYDLYYTSSDYFGEGEFEEQENISIYPLKDPLFFSPLDDKLDSDIDSEDSNAENDWRNEYPDEDDMLSVTEDDMVEAMKNVDLEDDLLSSEDEEGFSYSIDSEAAGFEEDIDETDVHRYGERYARFKARIKKSISDKSDGNHDFYYGDIDGEDEDDSQEYY